jgi:hypothetical protein
MPDENSGGVSEDKSEGKDEEGKEERKDETNRINKPKGQRLKVIEELNTILTELGVKPEPGVGSPEEAKETKEATRVIGPPSLPSPPRRLKSWIEGFLQFTKESESPDLFCIWTAISTISGALQDHVYVIRGYDKVYPNQYIILVAASGECRKGIIKLGPLRFLNKLPYANVVTGTTTSAGLFDAMTKTYNKGPTMAIHPDGKVFVLMEEMTYGFHQGDEGVRLIKQLIAMYDGGLSTDLTRKEGRKVIDHACINVGAAVQPKILKEIVSDKVVGAGFIGRCIWIHQEKARQRKAWPTRQVNSKLEADLLNDLASIHGIKGEFILSPEAYSAYQQWYEEGEYKARDGHVYALPGSEGAKTEYEKEYLTRKGTHVLKLMEVLNAEGSPGKVHPGHEPGIGDLTCFERSLKFLNVAERYMWGAFRYIGSDSNMLAVDTLNYLASRSSSNYSATFSELVGQFHGRIKSRQEFLQALLMLKEGGMVEDKHMIGLKKVIWRLTELGYATVFGKGRRDGGGEGSEEEGGGGVDDGSV